MWSPILLGFEVTTYFNTMVTCTHADGSLRVVDGDRGMEAHGRLEIFHQSDWQKICHTGFSSTSATVACLQLGYRYGRIIKYGSYVKGSATVPVLRYLPQCNGTELRLDACSRTSVVCHHTEVVGIECSMSNFEGTYDALLTIDWTNWTNAWQCIHDAVSLTSSSLGLY